ncbi:hypothetical protein Leryth_014715 [Lithospermum erythrorhizon]|nr:hypothetical protein Leryth_014715 [Lithospermum erythrorhizon]
MKNILPSNLNMNYNIFYLQKSHSGISYYKISLTTVHPNKVDHARKIGWIVFIGGVSVFITIRGWLWTLANIWGIAKKSNKRQIKKL